ncbi:hypothetical protein QFZ28_006004 [Neobacillus niacini]|uniref:hypothetical protein n=1 Tax=Neobacillus niacini TaxID=86668 RepID=UPI002780A23D|nr:hypothetical protein [Neobacillus niacini]MDQ1005426.1 hypothetical protein [Neobacillus niacini]
MNIQIKDADKNDKHKYFHDLFTGLAINVLKAQHDVFQLNNESEKGCWSLAQPNVKLLLPKEDAVLTRNLEVDLFQCLPIPIK